MAIQMPDPNINRIRKDLILNDQPYRECTQSRVASR